MLFEVKFIPLFLLITSYCQVWTLESFNDFPLTIDYGNYIINATLTDLISNEKYLIKEYINSSSKKRGKISISSDSSNSFDVHYGSDQRLVIQDNDCNLITYKTKWDNNIPGITKPLLNHILLIGPSLIYRLKNQTLTWQTGEDTEIRGTIMKSVHTTIGDHNLNITYYYKENLTLDIGESQPSRIQFTGHDPSDLSSESENLVLDIYLQAKTNNSLSPIVTPKPGIGCPIYFTDSPTSWNISQLVQDSVHYISIENINGPEQSLTINEIYANQASQLLTRKSTKDGITEGVIYDFTLGIIYMMSNDEDEYFNGECSAYPMGLGAPGARIGSPLEIKYLLDAHLDYKYLGKTLFENQPGFRTDVWEAIDYDVTINKFAKVVTTLYTVDSQNNDTSSKLVLVGKTIHSYNKISIGKYSLVKTIKVDYYDFGREISDEEFEYQLRVGTCYPDFEDRKTLAIQLDCKVGDCTHAVREHHYTFRREIKNAILNTDVISGSRIGNIEIELNSNKIMAYVMFLNFPLMIFGFDSSLALVSRDVLASAKRFTVDNPVDCLKQSAEQETTFEALAFCSEESGCYQIADIKNITEYDGKGRGVDCELYAIPFKNLNRYSRELSMKNLKKGLEERMSSFSFNAGSDYVLLTLSRVNEMTDSESESHQPYIDVNAGAGLIPDDENTFKITEAKYFGDCYRACVNFGDGECETFSYCADPDAKVNGCVVSTSVYTDLDDKQFGDSDCKIFSKNRLQDYIKINNREFINPTSEIKNHPPEDCASLCRDSDGCVSFQSCGETCKFGGNYTDFTTKFSQNCSIYIPKLTHMFEPTGRNIVTETYHTEMNLTLDQCAALCYYLGSNEYEECVSFNYCYEGITASSCYLSKFAINKSSTQTSYSDECINYELILRRLNDNKKQNTSTLPTIFVKGGPSGGVITGTIVLFIAVGLVFGLTGPFVYKKTKSMVNNYSTSSEHDSFSLATQSDEDI